MEAGAELLIHPHEAAPDPDGLRREVLRGLLQANKELPCKLFYDERGSALFEQICELEEYYLTRTEIAILERHATEVAAAIGPRVLLIEFGSGNSRKTHLLLDQLVEPVAYLPIDLSREQLLRSAEAVAQAYPRIEVHPLVTDYTQELSLPHLSSKFARRVAFFPGSSIGNFLPEQAAEFMRCLPRLLGPDGGLLVGVDLPKDPDRLHRAYNDRAGVTAEFNRNILVHVNHRLGADFRPEAFLHLARYDQQLGRIEMYLISQSEQQVHIGDLCIRLGPGERILTEVSYKHSLERFAGIARQAGLKVERVWTDPQQDFSLQWLTAW
jgi:dimethylhistidine N-methyltransferase